MSLDVSLINKTPINLKSSGIFVREDGSNKEISVEEWNSRFPNKRITTDSEETVSTKEVFTANITHNLNTMADECGVYDVVWRPEENGVTHANQLIEPIRQGLAKLKSDPERYKKFNPKNGWGDYDGLVEFLERYLQACLEYPNASVEASR
jgi:hypothetical protein